MLCHVLSLGLSSPSKKAFFSYYIMHLDIHLTKLRPLKTSFSSISEKYSKFLFPMRNFILPEIGSLCFLGVVLM